MISFLSLFSPLKVLATSNPETKTTNHFASTLSQKDFSISDIPKIEINQINSSKFQKIIDKFLGKNTDFKKNLKIIITDPQKQIIDPTYIQLNSSSDDQVQLTLNQEILTPGKYQIEIIDTSNNETITQDFTWGVLVINPDKSAYSIGETASFAIAVLDDQGAMVCNADVQLQIISPNGQISTLSTGNHQIITNPQCQSKKITTIPDYQAELSITQSGNYQIVLTATTINGTYTISDSFSAQINPKFIIKRITATRIYPFQNYPVTINFTPDSDFSGYLVDSVPLNFQIIPSSKFTIEKQTDRQVLFWSVNIKAGETVSLDYEYNPPNISPELFTLGPIQILDSNQNLIYRESRQWQIAADDTGIALDNTTTSGNNKTSNSASWNHTVATDGVLFVVVSSRNSTDANRPVTSITYNGASLTKACSIQNNSYDLGSEIWYITNPTTGSSASITVNMTGSGNLWAAAASSFTGVNTTNAIGTSNSTSASSTSISTSITPSQSNSWIIDAVYSKNDGAITPNRTQRSNQAVNSSGDHVGHSTTGPVSSSTPMSWSWSSSGQNAVQCALEILAAVNTSPVSPTLTSPTNNAVGISLAPTLSVVATDADNDPLQYRLILGTNSSFTGTTQTFDQTVSNTGWSNQNVGTSAYSTGTTATYTIQSNLNYSTIYYWKAQAIDYSGSNTWSTLSVGSSFTTMDQPNNSPSAPTNSTPANSAHGISFTPTLVASAFSDPDAGDSQTASQWQIATDSSFSNIVFDTGTTGSASNSVSVTTTLSVGTTYYWHVRYQDNHSAWSNYSSYSKFLTKRPPNTPSNTYPSNQTTKVSRKPTLTGSSYSNDDGDNQIASQWQIATDSGFSNIIWDTGTTDPVTSIAIPTELNYNTTYYWHVRYESNPWSPYSPTTSFTTEGAPSNSTKLKGVKIKGIKFR